MYILIDGENIDATLGVNILKRTPHPEDRPRWDRVLRYNPWAADDGVTTQALAASEHAANSTPTPHDPHEYDTHLHEHEMSYDAHPHDRIYNDPPSATGLFFLNAQQRTAMTFVQALLAIGWQPILLTSQDPDVKIVDAGIIKTLNALGRERPDADIVIASHDADYYEHVEALLEAGHRVAVICFREYLSAQLAELETQGLRIVDLEYDIRAFNQPLARVAPIDVEQFDPLQYI